MEATQVRGDKMSKDKLDLTGMRLLGVCHAGCRVNTHSAADHYCTYHHKLNKIGDFTNEIQRLNEDGGDSKHSLFLASELALKIHLLVGDLY